MIEIKSIKGIKEVGVEDSVEIRMYDDERNNITIGFFLGNSETDKFIEQVKIAKKYDDRYSITFQNVGMHLNEKDYFDLLEKIQKS